MATFTNDTDRDEAYMALVRELVKNHQLIIASDHPMAQEVYSKSLDTLKVLNRHTRAATALAKKVVAKAGKK